jgi:hypothetical protein
VILELAVQSVAVSCSSVNGTVYFEFPFLKEKQCQSSVRAVLGLLHTVVDPGKIPEEAFLTARRQHSNLRRKKLTKAPRKQPRGGYVLVGAFLFQSS